MAHGGPRSRAGRPRGARNKRQQAAIDAIATSGATTPLAYAISVMNDESAAVERRDRMAALAMPYLHSKLTPNGWLPTHDEAETEGDHDHGAARMVAMLMKRHARGEGLAQ